MFFKLMRKMGFLSWLSLLAASFGALATVAWGQTRVVKAEQQPVARELQAYASVEPIALLEISAAQQGVLSGLNILPGQQVKAGQKLAQLTGAQVQAILAQHQGNLQAAEANLSAAKKSLAIAQQQVSSRLGTQQALLAAQGAAAQAQANVSIAQAQLEAFKSLTTVESPADGTVAAVNASDGQRVAPGQTILTVQAAGELWGKAAFYGSDAAKLKVGMTGQFTPASDSPSVDVKVVAIFGSLSPDGGQSVGLMPTTQPAKWMNGEFGTVNLNLPERKLVAIPTDALILDRGQWWVLAHTASGDHPQAVTPGPTRGWKTFIEKGLEPGTQVVVENAYLQYHQATAQTYQPPD